jgi:hypothetical protein
MLNAVTKLVPAGVQNIAELCPAITRTVKYWLIGRFHFSGTDIFAVERVDVRL